MQPVELSVVVPCCNEQEALLTTHARLASSLAEFTKSYEIIYVNDGSTDGTGALLRAIANDDGRVRFLELSRNFGQAAAITAGLEFSRGTAVVILDADLQDPPEIIGEMMDKWRKGFDIVYGRRLARDGDNWFKRWTAAAFYRFLNQFSNTDLPIDVGEFRLMDRCVVTALSRMQERHRYVRGLVSWLGFRHASVYYNRAPRRAGVTKYPTTRLFRVAGDALFSFSLAPLRAAIWLGLCSAVLAMIGMTYAIVMRLFTNIWVSGWTLLFIAVVFLGGVQLLFLGVLGEYVGRIFSEVKRRPLYIVSDGIGFDKELTARICKRIVP